MIVGEQYKRWANSAIPCIPLIPFTFDFAEFRVDGWLELVDRVPLWVHSCLPSPTKADRQTPSAESCEHSWWYLSQTFHILSPSQLAFTPPHMDKVRSFRCCMLLMLTYTPHTTLHAHLSRPSRLCLSHDECFPSSQFLFVCQCWLVNSHHFGCI